MIDPWAEQKSINGSNSTGNHLDCNATFEDNFVVDFGSDLPDSQEYLDSLEKKLKKLKTNSGTLEQLAAKRETCMERLLHGSIDLPVSDFDLSIDENTDLTKTREILRHIIPQQPIHPGELVSIIKYDQFEPLNDESSDEKQSDLGSR